MGILKTIIELKEKGREFQSPEIRDSFSTVSPKAGESKSKASKIKPLRKESSPSCIDPEKIPMKRRLQILGSLLGTEIMMHQGIEGKPNNVGLTGRSAESVGPVITDVAMLKELNKLVAHHGREMQIPREILILFCSKFEEHLLQFRAARSPQDGQNIGTRLSSEIAEEFGIS